MSDTTLMAEPVSEPVVAEPVAVEGNPAPTEVPEWLSSIEDLPDDIRNDPSLKPLTSMQSLLKSYVNAQKMVGADKLIIPGKDANDDDWRSIFQKLGVPEKVEDYGVDLPEGVEAEDTYFGDFLKTAHEAGILPKQAKRMVEFQAQYNVDMAKEMEERQIREIEEQIDSFKAEEGDKFPETAFNAKLAVKQFDDEQGSFNELVTNNPEFGNNPKLIRFLARIASQLNEDTFRTNAVSNVGTTAEEATQKLNKIMGDISGPYYNADHLEHKRTVQEVEKLTALTM